MTLSAHPRKDETTAEIIVNEWSEETLADIIFGFGEERHARRIARAIVEARNHARITTSLELARIVSACLGEGKGKHPATKTFQALRIATNDELGALEDMLEKGVRVLASGGRMVVITFHSLEDRMVKHTFARFSREGTATLLSKKPIVPSREEVLQNRRSRSAKLRGLMKL
jgi:16S rRNA (cytosine1402-N4)-methyltransferase